MKTNFKILVNKDTTERDLQIISGPFNHLTKEERGNFLLLGFSLPTFETLKNKTFQEIEKAYVNLSVFTRYLSEEETKELEECIMQDIKVLMDNKELLEEFQNMQNIPIIEEHEEVYYLYATLEGIKVQYCQLTVAWDSTFSLDEHLQAVHELILEKGE